MRRTPASMRSGIRPRSQAAPCAAGRRSEGRARCASAGGARPPCAGETRRAGVLGSTRRPPDARTRPRAARARRPAAVPRPGRAAPSRRASRSARRAATATTTQPKPKTVAVAPAPASVVEPEQRAAGLRQQDDARAARGPRPHPAGSATRRCTRARRARPPPTRARTRAARGATGTPQRAAKPAHTPPSQRPWRVA